MVYSFFITQWYSPSKGDWTEQVKEDLMDFNISSSFDFIESKSAEAFKNLVKIRAKKYALEVLQNKKLKHRKMDNVAYRDLEMQDYFTSDQMDNKQKKTFFKYRTRMERFGENFLGGRDHVMCPVCTLNLDSQELSLQCPVVMKEIHCTGDIREIYGDAIRKEIVQTVTKVIEFRRSKIENG